MGKKEYRLGQREQKGQLQGSFWILNNHFSETETVCLQEKSNMKIKDPITVSIFFFFRLGFRPHFSQLCRTALTRALNLLTQEKTKRLLTAYEGQSS